MALRLHLILPELSVGLPSSIIYFTIRLIEAKINSYEFQHFMILFKLPVKIRKLWMERTFGSADNCSISEEFGQAFPLQDGMVFLVAIIAHIF